MQKFKKIFSGSVSKTETPQPHSCCSGHEPTQQHDNNTLKSGKY